MEAWTSVLQTSFEVAPETSATKLRWRRSFNGGRTLAQPAATAQQLQQARGARQGVGSSRRDTAVEIIPDGPANFSPDALMAAIANLLRQKGLLLTQVDSPGATLPGQWSPITSSTTGGPTGKMRLHLSSEAEVSLIHDTLHNKAFQAGNDTISLKVQGTPFRGRGARGRAGPPAAGNPTR